MEALEKEIEEAVQGVRIPPQPNLVIELKQQTDDIRKVIELIKGDAATSAGVLKVANSPFCGMARKATSVDQAANFLGVKMVVNIATTQMLRATVGEEIPGIEGFWYNAEDVAKAMSALAKQMKVMPPDEAYTLGLFHNVGVALMLQKYGEEYLGVMHESYKDGSTSLISLEDERFNSNHAQVGYYIAKSWKLPEFMGEIILAHHDSEALASGLDDNTSILYLLKMAEKIGNSHVVLGLQAQNHEWDKIKKQVFEHFGMSEYDFEEMEDLILHKLSEEV